MCGKQKNKGLIWTTLGKPQVFPGLPYPGLQDEGLHPVEKGGAFGSTVVVSWELRCKARLGIG